MPARILDVVARSRVMIAMITLSPLLFASCARDAAITAPPAQLTFGTWGGARSEIVTSATSTDVTYNCTNGNFPGNITLDSDGRFSVQGTYYPYVGPVLLGPPFLAQLSGQVSGNTLTFAVATYDTVRDTLIELGPATVVLGKAAVLEPCPVL